MNARIERKEAEEEHRYQQARTPAIPAFDMARWKQQDYAESTRWEQQQAYQRYRQGEWADPQPQKPAGLSLSKPWWQKAGDWLNHDETGQRIRNVAIGFVSGLVAGAVTGAIGGAIVGSFAGGVGAGPGALGGAIVGGIAGGISGLVTGIFAQPATPPGKVVVQSAIWGGVAGLLAGAGSVAAGLQGFAHGGHAWHVGLETTSHLNIVHMGVHPKYGFHIAFGAIKPYFANIHIYIQKAFPFFRIWRP